MKVVDVSRPLTAIFAVVAVVGGSAGNGVLYHYVGRNERAGERPWDCIAKGKG